MPTTLPPHIAEFVAEEVASGKFADQSAVVTTALEVYRELKQRHADLHDRIQTAVQQAERGEAEPLDMESILNELEQELDAEGQTR